MADGGGKPDPDALDCVAYVARVLAGDPDPRAQRYAKWMRAYLRGDAGDLAEWLAPEMSPTRGHSVRDQLLIRDRDRLLASVGKRIAISRLSEKLKTYFTDIWPCDQLKSENFYDKSKLEWSFFEIFSLWPTPINEPRLRQILKRQGD